MAQGQHSAQIAFGGKSCLVHHKTHLGQTSTCMPCRIGDQVFIHNRLVFKVQHLKRLRQNRSVRSNHFMNGLDRPRPSKCAGMKISKKSADCSITRISVDGNHDRARQNGCDQRKPTPCVKIFIKCPACAWSSKKCSARFVFLLPRKRIARFNSREIMGPESGRNRTVAKSMNAAIFADARDRRMSIKHLFQQSRSTSGKRQNHRRIFHAWCTRRT